jgi:hypothetical protein
MMADMSIYPTLQPLSVTQSFPFSFLINFLSLFNLHIAIVKEKYITANNRKHTDQYYVDVEHTILSVILQSYETWPIALREEYRSQLLSYYVS